MQTICLWDINSTQREQREIQAHTIFTGHTSVVEVGVDIFSYLSLSQRSVYLFGFDRPSRYKHGNTWRYLFIAMSLCGAISLQLSCLLILSKKLFFFFTIVVSGICLMVAL